MTVEEVMKAAGLTHGAFYAHFGSKQELQRAAVAYGQELTASRNRSYGVTKNGRKGYVDRYLSAWHRDNPGDGCTMAALAQEVARSTPEIKEAFEKGLKHVLAEGEERKQSIFETAALVGGIVLARAVQDQKFSDEILESVRRNVS